MLPKQPHRPSLDLAAAGLLFLSVLGPAQAAAADAPPWTPARMEEFLLRAEIVRALPLSEGVTHSIRVLLRDGQRSHEAHFQRVDVSKPHHPTTRGWELNFRDSYRFNIAAYRLSRLLGLDNVPVSVERLVDGEPGALTWWIDDALMTEKTRYLNNIQPPDPEVWNQQIYRLRVFDELIANSDRNLGNLVISKDWKLWMIDHTRAFRTQRQVRQPEQLVKCDRDLLEAMRRLDRRRVAADLGKYLSAAAIDALLARRDQIVEFFDRTAGRGGEAAVLFDYRGP